MGSCRCNEGKYCGVHFFKRSSDPDSYQERKKTFESKKSVKKEDIGKRVPEYNVDTKKHPEFEVE